eukprot:7546014-Alexandrium_andersonii.AAC.1
MCIRDRFRAYGAQPNGPSRWLASRPCPPWYPNALQRQGGARARALFRALERRGPTGQSTSQPEAT